MVMIDPNATFDLEAVQNYLAGPEFRDAVSAPDFEARCVTLFNAFDNGTLMTLAAAADFLGVRWEALGVLMAAFAPSYLPHLQRKALQ